MHQKALRTVEWEFGSHGTGRGHRLSKPRLYRHLYAVFKTARLVNAGISKKAPQICCSGLETYRSLHSFAVPTIGVGVGATHHFRSTGLQRLPRRLRGTAPKNALLQLLHEVQPAATRIANDVQGNAWHDCSDHVQIFHSALRYIFQPISDDHNLFIAQAARESGHTHYFTHVQCEYHLAPTVCADSTHYRFCNWCRSNTEQ